MEPDIKLKYSSDNQNGWFGVGWEISGFAYIERSSRMGAPNYDNSDTFSLNIDGAYYELVRENSNTSGVGYYRTKSETWMKLYFSGSSWELYTRDGRTYNLGVDNDSRVPVVGHSSFIRRWLVTKVTDKSGNYMTYTYDIDVSNGEYYPELIVYTNNNSASLSKVKTINFNKQTRTDNISPQIWWLTSRINEILVTIDGVSVDKYTFTYQYSKSTSNSLLTEIRRYGKGTIPEIQSMIYQSNSSQMDWFGSYGTAWPDAGYKNYDECTASSYIKVSFADLNGDGLVDFARKEYWNDPNFTININNGNGFSGYPGQFNDKNGQLVAGIDLNFRDINGDGLADLPYASDAYLNDGNYFRILAIVPHGLQCMIIPMPA